MRIVTENHSSTHILSHTLPPVPNSVIRSFLNGNPLQYSCLENPMDRGAWWATVHEVAESDMTKQLHFHLYNGYALKSTAF